MELMGQYQCYGVVRGVGLQSLRPKRDTCSQKVLVGRRELIGFRLDADSI